MPMIGLGRTSVILILLGSVPACGGGSETGATGHADGGAGAGEGGLGQGGSSARGGGGTGASTTSGGSGASSGGSGASSGGGASGGATGWLLGHEPSTVTEACVEYAAAQLRRREDCREYSELDVETAVRQLDECPDLFFSDGSGFTIEGAIACIDGWRSHPCEDLRRDILPSCVPAGTRGDGEACVYASQCESYACSTRRDSCGECLALVGEGQPCDEPTVACERGAACDGGVCAALSGDAVPGKKIGEACVGGDCPEGSECNYSSPDGYSRCMVRPTVGESCGGEDAPRCTNDAYCGESGTCRTRPGAGAPCARSLEGGLYCAFGHRCLLDADADPLTGICQKIQLPGESCASTDTTCIRGATCNDGVCEPVGSQGFFDDACGI